MTEALHSATASASPPSPSSSSPALATPSSPPPPDEAQVRNRAVRRTTLVALITNSSLALGQIVVGLLANAWSLVADAVHTLSDLMTDAMVLFASARGAQPADRDHPYGHERIETVTTMVLGVVLVMVGLGFLWASGTHLTRLDSLPPLHPVALGMALLTLAAKEGLFRYTLAAGRRLRSRLLTANAWHARSDAASSLVVAVGIGGSLLGFPFLEPLAAAIVGFIIIRIGVRMIRESLLELVDTGLPEAELQQIRTTLRDTPGVMGLHDLRTRRMAHRVLCDAHIQVSPRLSVSEGHQIAENARLRVCEAHPDVVDVLVHVDAENDDHSGLDPAAPSLDRATVLRLIDEALGPWLPTPERVQLHYLGNRVEVELLLPELSALQIEPLNQRIEQTLAAHPGMRTLRAYVRTAP